MARLEPCDWSDLPGWTDDDHAAALDALRRSAAPWRDGRSLQPKGLTPPGLERALCDVLDAADRDPRETLQRFLRPARVRGGPDRLTGYFEPVVAGSRMRSARFHVPLHRRPPEVARATPAEERRFGLSYGVRLNDALAPFHDRGAVMDGALDGHGLEIAYVESLADAFMIHVQGCARLETDRGTLRLTFDGKSGHAYRSLGKELAVRLGVSRETVTADRLFGWMRENPADADALLRTNPSYIYFREAEKGEGPIAAATVPLTAGRSVAVDRAFHAFGTPIWLAPAGLRPRLVIAQDTGSAIVGAGRGDLFVGSGPEAGLEAGRINHACAFFVLVPRDRETQGW